MGRQKLRALVRGQLTAPRSEWRMTGVWAGRCPTAINTVCATRCWSCRGRSDQPTASPWRTDLTRYSDITSVGAVGHPFRIGHRGGEVPFEMIEGAGWRCVPDGLVRPRRRCGTPRKPARCIRWLPGVDHNARRQSVVSPLRGLPRRRHRGRHGPAECAPTTGHCLAHGRSAPTSRQISSSYVTRANCRRSWLSSSSRAQPGPRKA